MRKIVTVIGARPQFIKAAVISRLIKQDPWKDKATETLIHTGQHYDKNMSEVFFKEMEIPRPDYTLNIGSGYHGEATGKMLIGIEKVLQKEKPDIVVVYGDTNSTLAGALAASKLHIPLAHVEAGLRSYWKKMPEEQNRVLTDHLSDFLFCPANAAVKNLLKEGIYEGVVNSGDIMYDAYLFYSEKMKEETDLRISKICRSNRLDINSSQEFYLLTVHRAENTDYPERLASIVEMINECEKEAIFPLHPRTKKQLEKFGLNLAPHIHPIDPVGYFDIIALQTKATFIVTDSGGMQKEAYFAAKPCITIRKQTEWTETVDAGWNHLLGDDLGNFGAIIQKISSPKIRQPFYGTGQAGVGILNTLISC